MTLLALHQLTVREAGPLDLVRIAARLNCEQICLFAHAPKVPVPGAAFTQFPLVDRANLIEMKSLMRGHDVGVTNIEFFPVTAGGSIEDYLSGFEVGVQLGARRAVTHIHDEDDSRALDTLGRLCDAASRFDLELGLEFMGLTPACNSVERAAWFVSNVGRRNIGIGVDALHLIRTGGTPSDLERIDPALFCYSQLCDGTGFSVTGDYRAEGQERLPPGDGDWPLVEMIRALPDHVAFDVEVPSTSQMNQGVDPFERAHIAMSRARLVMAKARGSVLTGVGQSKAD